MSLNRRPAAMKEVLPGIMLLTFCMSVACRVTGTVTRESDPQPIITTQTAGPTPTSPTATAKEPTAQYPPEELVRVGKLVLVEYGDIFRIDVYCNQQLDECAGEPMRLTEEPAIYVDPSWSPSGHEIVFASDLESHSPNAVILGVYVIGEMGGEPKPITTTGHNPDWSPSGEELAYATNEGDGLILLVNPDGDVHKAVGLPYSSYPHWSPDGTRIAFSAAGTGWPGDLYVLYLNDRRPDIVAYNSTSFMQWSPDGERIAFTALMGDKIDLYITEVGDFHGYIGETKHVTVDRFVSYPAWSPDGTSIAFVSRDQGNDNIFIASMDCIVQHTLCVDQIQQITDGSDDETNPIWFPDGSHLTYIAGSNASWRIEMVDLASMEIQVLVGGLLSPWQLDGYSK